MHDENNPKIPLQVGVKCILKNHEGRFLILRRNPNHVGVSGWDIPGGRIHPGTDLEENLKREITEETNLILISEPKLLHVQDIIRADKHVVRLTFAAECSGEVTIDPSEHTEYKWLFLEEINNLPELDSFTRQGFAKYATHFFPKLIRDNMAKIFKEKYGVETENKGIADTELYKNLLTKKLIEESTEVSVAQNPEDIKTELADVLEVIDSILKVNDWSIEEVKKIQDTKREIKGGFDQRIYMEVPFSED